jgi:hypothetical protein
MPSTSDLFSKLLSLISGGGAVTVLKDIVGKVLLGGSAGNAEQEALAYLNGKLNAQEGRTAAQTLARAMLKQGEDAMFPSDHFDLEQRITVGQTLFQNGALQMAQASNLFLALGESQAALERARGTAGEEAARAAREQAEKAFKTSTANIGRVVAGAAPQ